VINLLFQFANTVFFLMDGCLLAMFFVFPTEKKPTAPFGAQKINLL